MRGGSSERGSDSRSAGWRPRVSHTHSQVHLLQCDSLRRLLLTSACTLPPQLAKDPEHPGANGVRASPHVRVGCGCFYLSVLFLCPGGQLRVNSCTLLLKPQERLQERQWSLEAWPLFPLCRSPLPQGPALSPSPVFLALARTPEPGCGPRLTPHLGKMNRPGPAAPLHHELFSRPSLL